ncbi:sigma factor-like helix-turn-helix DNA-binding protein [Micromonospora chersina]|uniref:sigma factor-like helix-turn-helix DNA-binding protein n=1 Tax=Micromonospora chersina TaxID=47854 RepID=UPI00371203CC
MADQDSWRLPDKALRGYPPGDRSLARRLRLGASLLRNSIQARREVALADVHDVMVDRDPGGVDAALMAALRQLPVRQREVVALRVFLDLDARATAEVLGIAAGTVAAHLSRAVASLRGLLAPPSR